MKLNVRPMLFKIDWQINWWILPNLPGTVVPAVRKQTTSTGWAGPASWPALRKSSSPALTEEEAVSKATS